MTSDHLHPQISTGASVGNLATVSPALLVVGNVRMVIVLVTLELRALLRVFINQ